MFNSDGVVTIPLFSIANYDPIITWTRSKGRGQRNRQILYITSGYTHHTTHRTTDHIPHHTTHTHNPTTEHTTTHYSKSHHITPHIAPQTIHHTPHTHTLQPVSESSFSWSPKALTSMLLDKGDAKWWLCRYLFVLRCINLIVEPHFIGSLHTGVGGVRDVSNGRGGG